MAGSGRCRGDLSHLWLPLLRVCTAELLWRIEGFSSVSQQADLEARLLQPVL